MPRQLILLDRRVVVILKLHWYCRSRPFRTKFEAGMAPPAIPHAPGKAEFTRQNRFENRIARSTSRPILLRQS
jgi:hypothetical protein